MTTAETVTVGIAALAVIDALSSRFRLWQESRHHSREMDIEGAAEQRLRALTLTTIESMLDIARDESQYLQTAVSAPPLEHEIRPAVGERYGG